MIRSKDITGDKYGRLTAVEFVHKNKWGHAVWKFKCSCGSVCEADISNVRRAGRVKDANRPSCGCYALEVRTKHGYSSRGDRHPLSAILTAAKQRCYNKKNKGYATYGEKGVTICDEWLNDSGAFIEWGLLNGWSRGLQLDKDILCNKLGISPKIYSPETCQFISPSKNKAHSSTRDKVDGNKHIKISIDDIEDIRMFLGYGFNYSQLAKEYNVNPSTISRAIKNPSMVQSVVISRWKQ